MRRQKQRFAHNPAQGSFGDCLRTAIACVLDLDRDEVPHFNDGSSDTEKCGERANAWLASHELVLIAVPYPGEMPMAELLAQQEILNPGIHFLLSGMSRTGVNHCVVATSKGIDWDPSLADAGIIGPCDDGNWWLDFFGKRV